MHDSIALLDLSHKENLDAIPPVPFVVSNNLKYIKNKKNKKPQAQQKKKKKYKPLLFVFREEGNFTHISIIFTCISIFTFWGYNQFDPYILRAINLIPTIFKSQSIWSPPLND